MKRVACIGEVKKICTIYNIKAIQKLVGKLFAGFIWL
jgi:hypothetical protein